MEDTKKNILIGLDQAIRKLNKIKERINTIKPEMIQLKIEEARKLDPFFEFEYMDPSGLKQKGPKTLSITFMDYTDDGKIYT
jgi:hypothetical protein